MNIKKVIHSIKPPCSKCPYTLGFVKFVKSPCSECKLNDYNMYDILINEGIGIKVDPGKLVNKNEV